MHSLCKVFVLTCALLAASLLEAQEVRLAVPAQDLGEALRSFGIQTQQQLLFSEALVMGKRSRALQGSYEVDAALRLLLSDHKLTFRRSRNGVLLLREAPPSSPSALEPAAEPSLAEALPMRERIVEMSVTATRVHRDGYSSPTPTHVLSSEQMQARGDTHLGTLLNELPIFRATIGLQTNNVRSITVGSVFSDLRGLGPSRSLVLVDGRRVVPQIYTGWDGYQVDMGQLPALLVDRIEVVTGGASAQWGSDAVGGVVNVLLREDFEGLETELQAGIAETGDNKSVRMAALAGKRFHNGRTQVLLSADVEDNGGIGDVFSRSWGRPGWQLINNPGYPSNQQPRELILPDIRFSTMTPGGLLLDGPLAGHQFDRLGKLQPFRQGEFVTKGAYGTMAGGDNAGLNINRGVFIQPALQRQNFFAGLRHELRNGMRVRLDAFQAFSEGRSQTLPAMDFALPVHIDNPWLPQVLREEMLAAGLDTVQIGRVHYDIGHARSATSNLTRRLVTSLEAGDDSAWHWTLGLSYGWNDYRQRVYNNRQREHFQRAQDAVVDPGTGDIVCRASLQGDPRPCEPLNLLGAGNMSPDAMAFVTGTTRTQTAYEQGVVSANLQGQLDTLPAGAMAVAAGLEYRRERQQTRVDPTAEASLWESTNARSFTGDFAVAEGYVELVQPLLRRRPWLRSLDANMALRQAHYSTAAGNQFTWKLGLSWEPSVHMLVRLGRSRDIRAPNLYELNAPGITTRLGASYGGQNIQIAQAIRGNAALQPEKADTWTLGAVIHPPQWQNLRLSLDYYRVSLADAVAFLPYQEVLDRCYSGGAYFCDFVDFSQDEMPETVRLPFMNLNTLERVGADLRMDYELPWQSRVLEGEWSISGLLNWVDRYGSDLGNGFEDVSGDAVRGVPRVRATMSLNVATQRWRWQLQSRYVGEMVYNSSYLQGRDINRNHVPSMHYMALSAAYQLRDGIELFAVVNNITDKPPPIIPQRFNLPAQAVFHDLTGRAFRVGLRARLR